MKKQLSFFLILLLVLAAMMTGCGEEAVTTETEQPESDAVVEEEADANTDELGDLLSGAYVDMMKNDEYLMKYMATIDFEGQAMEVEATIAVSGDDSAMISKTNGMESTMIFKDDTTYMIDHASKTVTKWIQPEMEETGTIEDIEAGDLTYVGSGEEDGLVYEEYSTGDGSVKYYFDGKDLVKMSTIVAGETMVMEILEMSNNVPSSMFEIPSGYQIIEM